MTRKVDIRTDSSRRFENGIANSLALVGMIETLALIEEEAKSTDFHISRFIDVYPHKDEEVTVTFSTDKLQSLLGVTLDSNEIEAILERFKFTYDKEGSSYAVTIPPERLDLRIEEDVIEEIGRVYGYVNIESKPISEDGFKPNSNKEFKVIEKIKNIFTKNDFSEVQTYMFGEEGDVEVLYPAASDKTKVRNSLVPRLEEALKSNGRHADLLGLSDIKIFEIGKVVRNDGECLALGIAVKNIKKDKVKEEQKIQNILGVISEELGVSVKDTVSRNIIEIDIQEIIEGSKDISEEELREIMSHADDTVEYKVISPYPFVLRDISVWTPEGTSVETVRDIIKNKSGDLLVRLELFDEYKKDNRVSYAFNMVFQSCEKTLTDTEVNSIVKDVGAAFLKEGWEVR